MLAGIVVAVAYARIEHATLDAAGIAVRDAVRDTAEPATEARLRALHDSFAVWGVTAAAFDRDGGFVAGDDRLRGDGLPAGRASAPAAGRQVAYVATRDGYVLVVNDPVAIGRLRWSMLLGAAAIVTLVLGLATLVGGRWAVARGRAADYLHATIDALPSAARGGSIRVSDPVFGGLSVDVAALAARLSRTIADRNEGEERLRAFLSEAAHELRTPLAIAVGYIGILERGGFGDPVLASRIVRDVAVEHMRLQMLVERILQLARLDAVPGDGAAAADVVRIIEDAVALVRPLDPERSIATELRGGGWAAIPPDDLRDALRNVLENALRYAPRAAIRIHVEGEGDAIAIRIDDAGPGMDAFTAAHAFDRFFRGPNRGDVAGSGLGLAIVRRIAERAGGAVTLSSAPGSGTTVLLRFLRASENSPPPQA